MKFYKPAALALTAFVATNVAYAAELKVINNADKNIQVFIRGEGSNKHHVETLAPHTSGTYMVDDSMIESKPTFEVIASTGNQGNPDWKLLGGTCKYLDKDINHTIIVESTIGGLKTSCKILQ